MDEMTYWSKQEIFTKDGVHYRLKGHVVEMSSEYDRHYDFLYQDRIRALYNYVITFRITEGPLAKVRGVNDEYGTFKVNSWQDAIDAGFLELVAPIKH